MNMLTVSVSAALVLTSGTLAAAQNVVWKLEGLETPESVNGGAITGHVAEQK